MKDRFPNDRALTASILLASAALLGLCLLIAVQLNPAVERFLYYVFFLIMFTAAIVYNVLAAKKGWWLYRRMRRPKR